MLKTCPWCQAPSMHPYRNRHKTHRRRLAQAGHLLLLIGLLALLLVHRFFEAGLLAFASFALMYMMMCSPYFNDFRVCASCGRIESVVRNIDDNELNGA